MYLHPVEPHRRRRRAAFLVERRHLRGAGAQLPVARVAAPELLVRALVVPHLEVEVRQVLRRADVDDGHLEAVARRPAAASAGSSAARASADASARRPRARGGARAPPKIAAAREGAARMPRTSACAGAARSGAPGSGGLAGSTRTAPGAPASSWRGSACGGAAAEEPSSRRRAFRASPSARLSDGRTLASVAARRFRADLGEFGAHSMHSCRQLDEGGAPSPPRRFYGA